VWNTYVNLEGQAQYQGYEVGNGQVDEVVIGAPRVHAGIMRDHPDGHGVADDPGDEDEDVEDAHGHQDLQRGPLWTQEVAFQVVHDGLSTKSVVEIHVGIVQPVLDERGGAVEVRREFLVVLHGDPHC
jgi:hypothetical protein